MSVNIQAGTLKKWVQRWNEKSIVAGKSSDAFSFEGVKTLKVLTVATTALGDYTRSGTSRYGTPTDVQDTEQTLSITQDKAFARVIDKGDNSSQYMLKQAGRVMKEYIDKQVVPMQDKRCILEWCKGYGQAITIETTGLTKANIVEKLFAVNTLFINNSVPFENAYLYIKASEYTKLRLSPEFIGVDKLAAESLTKGVVGEVADFKVVKTPDSYFPDGISFLVAQKDCVLAPNKINDTNIHSNPPGINGHLIEGRFLYDAFVLTELKNGVVVGGTAAGIAALAA